MMDLVGLESDWNILLDLDKNKGKDGIGARIGLD